MKEGFVNSGVSLDLIPTTSMIIRENRELLSTAHFAAMQTDFNKKIKINEKELENKLKDTIKEAKRGVEQKKKVKNN